MDTHTHALCAEASRDERVLLSTALTHDLPEAADCCIRPGGKSVRENILCEEREARLLIPSGTKPK